MKLDPILSLAMNMHASQGVYALLLGSGVSRAAKIPTGWEVTLELIRRIAKMEGGEPSDDPAAWYRDKYGEEPDYSRLLDALATTPDQRQQLLRAFFEPTEQERVDGVKAPTAAHHAIARLVAGGYVRVILTTNFDPLMETALLEAGIRPIVLSTPDSIAGATPLVHQKCVVVKLHGDYLDPRIKNTPAELDRYEPAVDAMLDRVLDDFGLIIAGWSGEYDTALRRAMERCKTRRFGFYWTSLGDLRGMAEKLVATRAGVALKITGADEFFSGLAEKVSVLNEMQGDDPVSTATAVALVKRYLGEPRQLIRLADLVANEAAKAQSELQAEQERFLRSPEDQAAYAAYATRYLAITKTLRAVVANAAFWGREASLPSTIRAVTRMAHDPAAVHKRGGASLNDAFRVAPAMAVMYSACLGYVAADDLLSAARLLYQVKVTEQHGNKTVLVNSFHSSLRDINIITKAVPGLEKMILPFTELLFKELRTEIVDMLADPASYEIIFSHLELLVAMVSGDLGSSDVSNTDRIWTTPGRFVYRNSWPDDPLFYAQNQGDELGWCRQQEPFQAMISAGLFKSDWARLINIRRAIAVNAHHWRNSTGW